MQTWRSCCGCGCIWCSSFDRETNSIFHGGVFKTTAEAKRAGTGATLDGFPPETIYAIPGTWITRDVTYGGVRGGSTC